MLGRSGASGLLTLLLVENPLDIGDFPSSFCKSLTLFERQRSCVCEGHTSDKLKCGGASDDRDHQKVLQDPCATPRQYQPPAPPPYQPGPQPYRRKKYRY